jgi:hypothetical protein
LHGMGLAVSRAFQRARAGAGKLSTALGLCVAFAVAVLSIAVVLDRLLPEDARGALVVFSAATFVCILLSALSSTCEGRGGLLRVVATVLTFHFVCVGWVFFRAPTFGQASLVLQQITTLTTFHPNLPPVVAGILLLGLFSHHLPARAHAGARLWFTALPAVAQGLLLFGVAVVLHEAASATAVPFVYFQF